MRPVWVTGIGLWAPGFPTASAWSAGRAEPSADRPACDILSPRIGRYCSLVTRMAIEAFTQAGRQAGADLATVASVFGSAYGEIRIAFEQLEMIRQEGVPSPARFKNSVHNTAGGHVSIAVGNTGFSTALAAGRATFAMSLLEAWAWLEAHGGQVIVCVADESLPEIVAGAAPYEPLGVAFHLCVEAPAPALGRLSAPRRGEAPESVDGVPGGWADNPCAAALPLVEALARKRSGTVPLELCEAPWCADLDVEAEAAR